MIELLIVLILLIAIIMTIRKGFKENNVDWGHSAINCIDGLMRYYCRHFQRLKYDPLNLPEEGGVLVVCNHVSGLDPLIMLTACNRPLRFMIAVEEYNRPVLNRLFKLVKCIPVERTAKPEVAFRKAIKELKKGEAVALFPHGGIHTDDEVHKPIKKGVFKLAQITRSSIVPTRLTGIRKPGSSFMPLFLRGNVRLQVYKHLSPDFIEEPDAQQKLGDLLLGKISSIEN